MTFYFHICVFCTLLAVLPHWSKIDIHFDYDLDHVLPNKVLLKLTLFVQVKDSPELIQYQNQ